LPLVRHHNSYWVLLFFRDINPVGLNVPNGASESEEEFTEVRHFMAREFSEEIVILNGPPQTGAMAFQPPFQSQGKFFDINNPPFANQHNELRRIADELFIGPDQRGREVNLMDTPFEVNVRSNGRHGNKRNVIFTINPAEFGIEVMQPCCFELQNSEYIIDGEYDISRQVLVRRLPILLRLTRLQQIFESCEGSLGEWILPESEIGKHLSKSHDGKLLPEISPRDCKVFDADVSLRHLRAGRIIQRTAKGENLDWELAHISKWLERYEAAVLRIQSDGLRGKDSASRELRTLCPVTWKTLELGFSHGLFSELLM